MHACMHVYMYDAHARAACAHASEDLDYFLDESKEVHGLCKLNVPAQTHPLTQCQSCVHVCSDAPKVSRALSVVSATCLTLVVSISSLHNNERKSVNRSTKARLQSVSNQAGIHNTSRPGLASLQPCLLLRDLAYTHFCESHNVNHKTGVSLRSDPKTQQPT